MNNKLVEDYLNRNSHIINEKVTVKSCIDNGSHVTVYIEWENDENINTTYLNISMFDLIGFIYSKK